MQAAMMRLGTLVYLYGGGAQTGIQVSGRKTEAPRIPYPIPPPVLDSCIQTLCVSMSFKGHINQFTRYKQQGRSTAGACGVRAGGMRDAVRREPNTATHTALHEARAPIVNVDTRQDTPPRHT
jgi:hypothetical protein